MEKVWRYTIDLPPMGTPRPNHRFVEGGEDDHLLPAKVRRLYGRCTKTVKS
ncbi:Uncharacterised protein [Staphylococcus intermedius NCTC 11048]|uniref:Uncharacterized protein n=1 Tax=Staphylococcus intermedius NCTC 11048 TaxID=1141106 RepID=A0A380FXM6_STAIN|nr:Uncharacterised protein [Staphylococcus intermedius NCTC 11048]